MSNYSQISWILNKLRSLRIETDRERAFSTHLDRLLTRNLEGNLSTTPLRFSAGRETRGVMVIDGPGGGKTTLIDRVLSRHPALGKTGISGPHYLEASVPSPATFKSMGATLPQRTGYPIISSKEEGWSMWTTLRGRLKDLGLTVLWIDEAHDLFCADRNLILRALKALMQGDEAVILILSGTERLSEIIRSDQQVQRRLSTLILPPVAEASDGPCFEAVIGKYCQIAGLEAPIELDLLPRLFHAGRYRFGRCVEIIIGAIELALIGGAPRLDIDHFAEFWAMHEGCSLGENIFLAKNWPQIDPDREDEEGFSPSPRGRRRRA